MTLHYEHGAAFAARFWGGPGIEPEPVEATMSPRNPFDGGRYRLPAGWAFRADGFRYRVWFAKGTWHMESHDGAFAEFWLVQQGTAPAQWYVTGLGPTRQVPALVVTHA